MNINNLKLLNNYDFQYIQILIIKVSKMDHLVFK